MRGTVEYTCKAGKIENYDIIEFFQKMGTTFCHLKKNGLEFKIPLSVVKVTAFNLKPGIILYDHQKAGILHLLKNPCAYLGDEMGLGKTIQAIIACDNSACKSIIIVCPASLQKNWKIEIKKFSKYPEKFQIFSYGKIPDIDCIQADTILVCDEAHYIKNHDSIRSKKVSAFSLHPYVIKSWFLSGTMLTKSGADAYPVLSLLKDRITPTKQNYYNHCFQFCNVRRTRFGTAMTGVKNEDVLKAKIADFYLGRKKKDVLNLPEKIRTIIPIQIDRRLADESLKLFEIDYARELRTNLTDNVAFATVRKELGIAKIKKGIEYIKEQFDDSDESIIIFCYHRAVVEALSNSLSDTKKITGDTPLYQRHQIVQDFQAGNIKYLICNIIAAGTGLTLTRSSNIVFFEVDVTPSNNLQAEDRIHRIGQKGTCNIRYLCAENSLDERMFAILEQKTIAIKKII